jgi:hypothetical protein
MRIFSLLFLILTSLSSSACDCARGPLDEDIKGSDNIFSAQVIKQEITWIKKKNMISPDEKPDSLICSCDIDGIYHERYNFCLPMTVFTLKVDREFKGETNCDIITVYGQYDSNCYENLPTGGRFLFYLTQSDRIDIYGNSLFAQVSACNRIEHVKNKIKIGDKIISEIEYLLEGY